MRHYPGRHSPVIACLRGDITVRMLRVMVEGLPPDPVLLRDLGESPWLEQDWMLYDIANHIRALHVLTYNVNRGTSSPMQYEPLPMPGSTSDEADDDVSIEQSVAEAELTALMHRER